MSSDPTASIQGRRYDASGSPEGGEFQVNTYTISFQRIPSVAVDADGDFVVVWWSYGNFGSDTDGRSIHGQRYAGPLPPPVILALSPSGLLVLVALVRGAGALILRRRFRLPS